MKVLKTLTVLVISLVVLAFTSKLNSEKTISEMVAEKQDLSTLLTALQAADLVETLKGEGPYTVFAPNNDAFYNLPAGRLDELLKPENKEELVNLLKYHVVAGRYTAADLEDGQMLETLEGKKIKVSDSSSEWQDQEMNDSTMMEEHGERMDDSKSTDMSGLKINRANVVQADLMASNGIIHIIDAVVMPTDVETIGTVE